MVKIDDSAKDKFVPDQYSIDEIDNLLKNNPEINSFDLYPDMVDELFEVLNPADANGPNKNELLHQFRKNYIKDDNNAGSWFYYQWLNIAIHLLPEKDHFLVRTARNRELINLKEQKKFESTKVGVAGLSVGSSAVQAIVMSGGSRSIRIADADTIELSNLNRLRAGVGQIGLEKSTWIARWINELDPYYRVDVFAEGINRENIEEFVDGLDIIVDEMDDLTMKVKLRQLAKERKIPVIMATDAGDNVLLDIERYDKNPKLEVFHGILSPTDIKKIQSGDLTKADWMKLALKVVDVNHSPTRMLECVPLIGRTIAGVPQLGGTAMAAGSMVAYVMRLIANDIPIKSGKILINTEKKVLENYGTEEYNQYREQLLAKIGKMLT